jgi:aspartate aminotransferase
VQQYVADSSEILKKQSEFIYKELSVINIQCTKSKGSFYMLIGFNEYKKQILKLGITTSFDLTNYVLVNYKITLLPRIDFGFEKEELFFRIAFVDFDGKKVMEAFSSDLEIDLDFIKRNTPTIFS